MDSRSTLSWTEPPFKKHASRSSFHRLLSITWIEPQRNTDWSSFKTWIDFQRKMDWPSSPPSLKISQSTSPLSRSMVWLPIKCSRCTKAFSLVWPNLNPTSRAQNFLSFVQILPLPECWVFHLQVLEWRGCTFSSLRCGYAFSSLRCTAPPFL